MDQQDFDLAMLAIAEATQCHSLKPDDPRVGAVLKRKGEPPIFARRGLKAPGDHAEFTLLQKILRSTDLTQGATLYTTLEPCTTRSHDKLPCADWIIRKGIRRVVVGILDPNPTICGRGYWKLMDAGIHVELFPPQLAERIVELNQTFVNAHRAKVAFTSSAARTIQQRKSPLIAPYVGLGWGDALSLQDCPNLREGWPVKAVGIRLDPRDRFVMVERLRAPYASYCSERQADSGFRDDRDKLMLATNPVAFSDSPTLVLDVLRTKWSEVQFYRNNIATIDAEKRLLIEDLIRGSLAVAFPSALCMHLVVITRDRKLLLTRRSPKVAYHPSSWSASIEEQIDRKDLVGEPTATCEPWARRSLTEELGLSADAYDIDMLRLLSVFLESDTMNVSVAACVELSVGSDALDPILRALPRTDYEFTEWAFLPCERQAVASELVNPSRNYHPTTGYRLLLTFLREFGVPKDEEIKALT